VLIKTEVKRLWLGCATSHGESKRVRTVMSNHFRNHATYIAVSIYEGWQAARLSGKADDIRMGLRLHNVMCERSEMIRRQRDGLYKTGRSKIALF
jgi:hypothetical protein